MLGKEKLSLGENTLVALHIVKDTIRLFGSETSVPITKDLLAAARKAHSEYQLYLREQRCQKVTELHKAVELEKKLEEETTETYERLTPSAAKRRREIRT